MNPTSTSLHELGIACFNAGRLEEAAAHLTQAVQRDPLRALYHRDLGELSRRLGRLEQAIACGVAATKLAPRDVDAYYNLGLAYTDAHDYANAITAYRRALKLDARHGFAWNNLGSALEQQGDKSGAEKAYAKAIAIDARHAEAQNNLGAIHSEQGRFEAAQGCFEAAIAARPDFVEAHYNLSSLKTYTRDDPHLAHLEAVHARRAALPAEAHIRYAFALGKALDDIGDYDRAFAAYDEGNRVQHSLLPMDETHADALLERIVTCFDADFFAARHAWRGAADEKRTPIFIVGMPRSGTTLLEQILSSHGAEFGAGELGDLNAVATAAAGAGPAMIDGIVALDEAQVRALGEDYLRRVWQLAPQSPCITDKMPANFFYLGLIHLALPGAKIIHAMRDPMDSCFSCFSRLFNDTMVFAYDQGTLGRYYVRYMKMMAHWHRVLPAGSILDLAYEDMVADTETQARRVIDFVGLPWRDSCLEFHKNRRIVKTASVMQVRKPIYKTSVARWKHFARHLQPLHDIVRPYRPADDAPDFSAMPAVAASPATAPLFAASTRSAESWHGDGIALYRQNRFDEALAHYEHALALRPDMPEMLNSKGFLLQDIGRLEEARECFARAVQLAPGMAMARLNLGMAQLKLGDWEAGWENYEARWTGSAESSRGEGQRLRTPLPQWNGEADCAGKRLLVIGEQGFGDTFQFARYLPLAAQRFARVGFVCSVPTLRLMEVSCGDAVALFARLPADFADWDLECPLMSLPRAFATRPQSIPATVPYLHASAAGAAYWKSRLERAAPGRFRVGIAWAGRKAHMYDARRSLRLEQLLPLLRDERVTWVSLQKWAPEDVRPAVPAAIDWLDWTEELVDFADTAALVAGLDLVISIDSAMVHLAGALGRPVWMLNRFDGEWRWLTQRSDTPWYPQQRIFNQPAFGDWASVLNEICAALAALPLASAPRPKQPKQPKQSKRALAPRAAVPPPAASFVAPAAGTALTLEQALELAGRHQAAGRLAEAEALLRQILAALPQHAHAMHLLGVVLYQGGRTQEGIGLVRQAVALSGGVALFCSNLAEMCRQQGLLDEAISSGRRAVELDPAQAAAHSNLGIAYYDAKDYDRAEACHRRALELAPRLLQSLNNLGSIARARKDLDAAAVCYQQALALDTDFLESLSNLGAVLVEDERPQEALPYLERALQLRPDYPEAMCNLGLVRLKQDRLDAAEALLQRTLQLRPGYPEALVGLAGVRAEQERLAEAETLLRRATEAAPAMVNAWYRLGNVCAEQAQPEPAEAAYARVLALDPAHADAIAGIANLRLEAGAMREAETLLREAIALEPDNIGPRFQLTQMASVKPGDANLAALEALAEGSEKLPESKRIALHYALGKSYDDLKQFDRAFVHFDAGARLKRASFDYDAQAEAARVQRIAEIVDADFLHGLRGAGNASAAPVFVLGMPRSGTTLTEQIIASHPAAFGAGELPDLLEIVQGQPAGGGAAAFPDNLAGLGREALTAWGDEYVARLMRRAPDARRITDKMPSNYLALGLISAMLPKAKIIHVTRNPVDICLSCYTRLFHRQQHATYDLAELGRHYTSYARLMRHWQALLPGRFLELRYEDVIADMATQARRLIDFCELPWNDACLAFHKTERSIRTASVAQVRQPIYATSVERWRHYETHLAPLLEALGEFAPRS